MKYSIDELLKNEKIDIGIYKEPIYFYPKDLKIKRVQTYVLKEQGISKMNPNDIFDVSKKSDIYLNIRLTTNNEK